MQLWHGTLRQWVISGQISTLLGQQWNTWQRNWFALSVWRGSSKATGCAIPVPHPAHPNRYKHPHAQLRCAHFDLLWICGPSSEAFDAVPFTTHICCDCKHPRALPPHGRLAPDAEFIEDGDTGRVCTTRPGGDKTHNFLLLLSFKSSAKIWFKQLKILLTEINIGRRTFDLRDSSFHLQIHYPLLNCGVYYKSLFLHSL